MGEKPETKPVGTNGYDLLVALLDVLKGAFWPGLILFVFVVLMEPVVQTIRLIPGIASRADVVTFGEFKVELSQTLDGIDTDPAIKAALVRMNEEGLKLLLSLSGDAQSFTFCGESQNSARRDGAENLSDAGLVRIRPALVAESDDCIGMELTDLGSQTRVFLVAFIAEALQ